MLVLSRKSGETIVIDGDIEVTVLEVRGNHVKLGVTAPPAVAIRRAELLLKGPTHFAAPMAPIEAAMVTV